LFIITILKEKMNMSKFKRLYFWIPTSIFTFLGLTFQVNAEVNSGPFERLIVVFNAKLYPSSMRFLEGGKWKTTTKISHSQWGINYYCDGYSDFGHGCDGYGVCHGQDVDDWYKQGWYWRKVDGITVVFKSKYYYNASDLKARLWNGSSWSSPVPITSSFWNDYYYYEVTNMNYKDSDLTDEPLIRIEYWRPVKTKWLTYFVSDKSEIGGGSFGFCTGFH
jgi:hypothetical protein